MSDWPVSLHFHRRPAAENSTICKRQRFKIFYKPRTSQNELVTAPSVFTPTLCVFPPLVTFPTPTLLSNPDILSSPSPPPSLLGQLCLLSPSGNCPFFSIPVLASSVSLQLLTLQLLRPRRAPLSPVLPPLTPSSHCGWGHLSI